MCLSNSSGCSAALRIASFTIIILWVTPSVSAYGDTPEPIAVGAGAYASAINFPIGNDSDTTWASAEELLDLYNTLYIAPALKTRAIPTDRWWSNVMFSLGGGSGHWKPIPYQCQLWFYPGVDVPTESGMKLQYPKGWLPRQRGSDYDYMDTSAEVDVDAVDQSDGRPFVSPHPVITAYGDWSLAYQQVDSTAASITTHLCRGVPFVWVQYSGVNPLIHLGQGADLIGVDGAPIDTSTGWFHAQSFAAVVNGQTFGIFAAPNQAFHVTADGIEPSPAPQSFIVYALLPSTASLKEYGRYAYAMVTDTAMSYRYDRPGGRIITEWQDTTSSLDGVDKDTLQGWLPHHWRTTVNDLALLHTISYITPRGPLQVAPGHVFHITWPFRGIVPMVPKPPDHAPGNVDHPYQRLRMRHYLNGLNANDVLASGIMDTYFEGKNMGALAQYVGIADQLGWKEKRAELLTDLENQISDWDTYTPGKKDHYFAKMGAYGTLIGVTPYTGIQDFNDHHFNYGYHVFASAMAGMEDPAWLARYGQMAKMIARDYADWDRDDRQFPYLRHFDVWEGHSNANGLGEDDGNNENSTSEAMNSWVGLFLLGSVLGDRQMVDTGAMGYAIEGTAFNEYYQDWKHTNFPPGWYSKIVSVIHTGYDSNDVWYTPDPAAEYLLQLLPSSHWNYYMAPDPAFAQQWFDSILPDRAIAARLGIHQFTLSDPNDDISLLGDETAADMLGFEMLFNPDAVTAKMDQYWDQNKSAGTAPSMSGVVYYTAHSLAAIGRPDTTCWTDIPTSQVFINPHTGVRNAVIYNPTGLFQKATIYKAGKAAQSVKCAPHDLISVAF